MTRFAVFVAMAASSVLNIVC